MNMSDYLNEFECLNIKLKEYKIDLPEPVLAYCANISQEKDQLARATLTELTYVGMKKQLKKILDETGGGISNTIQSGNINIKPVFQASCIDDEENVLYGESYRNQGHRNFQGCTNYCGCNQRSFRATNNEVNQKQEPVRKKNSPDAYGYPSNAWYVNPLTIGLIIAQNVTYLRHQLRTKKKILHCLQKVYKAVKW